MKNVLGRITPYEEEPDFLSNWVKLSKHLPTLHSEGELLKILKTEIIFKRRVDVISRTYSRYNKIRKEREFKEILADILRQP